MKFCGGGRRHRARSGRAGILGQ